MASHCSLLNRTPNRHRANNRNGTEDEQPVVRCEGRLISMPRRMRLLEGLGNDDVKSMKKMSKLLLNVTFEGSLGVMQLVISPDATVRDLIKTAVETYLREKRRPLLEEPLDALQFELHYSPFSFECLDPNEKLIRMTSRNCFLCAKHAAVTTSPSSCSDAKEFTKSMVGSSFSFTKVMNNLFGLLSISKRVHRMGDY